MTITSTQIKVFADDAKPCPILQDRSGACVIVPSAPPVKPSVTIALSPVTLPTRNARTTADYTQLYAISASFVPGACAMHIASCTIHLGIHGRFALVGYGDGNRVAGTYLAQKNGSVWRVITHGGGWLSQADILQFIPSLGADGASALEASALPQHNG